MHILFFPFILVGKMFQLLWTLIMAIFNFILAIGTFSLVIIGLLICFTPLFPIGIALILVGIFLSIFFKRS